MNATEHSSQPEEMETGEYDFIQVECEEVLLSQEEIMEAGPSRREELLVSDHVAQDDMVKEIVDSDEQPLAEMVPDLTLL